MARINLNILEKTDSKPDVSIFSDLKLDFKLGRTFNDEELIEGVQNMQILYGENTNGAVGVDGYFTANAVTNWANVVSVKISLLMRTIRQYGTTIDTNTFNVLGQNLGPFNDRHRRRIFAATIEIRNRRDTIIR